MNKKLLIALFLVIGVLMTYQSADAFYANRERLNDSQNRDQNMEMVKYRESGVDRDSFFIERDKSRSENREKRMIEREERLKNAVENGCITSEEMEQRMNEWKQKNRNGMNR